MTQPALSYDFTETVDFCVRDYAAVCARFRERILRAALKHWVSEAEPVLFERSGSGLDVEIIGIGAAGHGTVSVAFPAKLRIKIKGLS